MNARVYGGFTALHLLPGVTVGVDREGLIWFEVTFLFWRLVMSEGDQRG